MLFTSKRSTYSRFHDLNLESNQPGETEKESNEIESAKVQALEGHTKEVGVFILVDS